MIKNGVYFIVIALLVAELFKILIYVAMVTSEPLSKCVVVAVHQPCKISIL